MKHPTPLRIQCVNLWSTRHLYAFSASICEAPDTFTHSMRQSVRNDQSELCLTAMLALSAGDGSVSLDAVWLAAWSALYDALRADSQSKSCRRSFIVWISSNPVVSASSCSANSDENQMDLIRVFVDFFGVLCVVDKAVFSVWCNWFVARCKALLKAERIVRVTHDVTFDEYITPMNIAPKQGLVVLALWSTSACIVHFTVWRM